MKKKEEQKIFMLDTNIPLQDPMCLTGFKEHDICIPITVIEELDKFKKGNETKNVNTREFLRRLEKLLVSPDTCREGAKLGTGLGKVFIELGSGGYPKILEATFMEDTPDHRILAAALSLKEKTKKTVILVTNDINFKLKAKSVGVQTEEYLNESVSDMDKIFTCISEITLSEKEWAKLYQTPSSTKKKKGEAQENNLYKLPTSLKKYPCNHLFILRKDDDPNFRILARKTNTELIILQEGKLKIKEISPRNSEQSLALEALLNPSISLIAITGKAGTGKTLIALAAAMEQKKSYKEILVARPAMEMSDKTLGFLPGDKNEKIDPYMMPIYDNLAVIKERIQEKKDSEQAIKDWAKSNGIEVLVLNYVRGRSLAERFIIIDEAQNLTPHEIKTIVTRAGEGTKIVVIGDISQIDSPYQNERSNGLSFLIDKWKGEPEFVHIHMKHGERSALADKAGKIM